MGPAYATQQNHRHFVRSVVGALVLLLVFTGFVSICEAYPAMICDLNRASAGSVYQHHQDTFAAVAHDHRSATHDHIVNVDAKSGSPSCCDAQDCEACRNYFNGHLHGLISVLTESAPLQYHPTFAPPPSRLSSVTSIPEPHPPKYSHA